MRARTISIALQPDDGAAKKLKAAVGEQPGYEILPNEYFYRYQPPTTATDLLAEFWRLETEAEAMLAALER